MVSVGRGAPSLALGVPVPEPVTDVIVVRGIMGDVLGISTLAVGGVTAK